MFTQQHYEAIADAIGRARLRFRKGEVGLAMLDYAIQEEIALTFEQDDPRFDRVEFGNRVREAETEYIREELRKQ